MDGGIANRLLTFADDTKLVGTVSSDSEIEHVQISSNSMVGL